MTSDQIKEAAIRHFAAQGFEGASLAAIANEVGIKKQSIYTHFKSKDELFLAVMTEVLNKEVEYIKKYFVPSDTKPLKNVLYQYLAEYSNRYEKDDNTKFMLRICFLPPSHLYEEVMNHVYSYLDTFEELLTAIFTNEHVISVNVSEAAIAYMGLVDAVLVEMLYGGKERFNKRLPPCWNVFWNGIS
ncbi:TetR/AcrR family transcriptional regulator [Metabacillus idriensis]|uniref:TetR/AcrR family transcriptional regulator n=1 Tax=Metabacillus idriensis TaxID=324768 RepID=UPI001639F19B|nr:TetR/AcrR family transcriptional regulator [Metabacillus idriensis]QNG60515.1 TetR/AcrR family transcriptional regulator [Bacillus sp. PAMC26568]